jgi:hypothetical protein
MVITNKGDSVHKILFDNSGSMSELGKEQLLINALRFSRQYIELNNVTEFVSYHQIGEKIDEIKIENNKDIVILPPGGRCSGKVISEWILPQENTPILWLTDGYNSFSEEEIFNLSKKANITVVALGCDAGIEQLERFSSPIFMTHNLDAALTLFFFPPTECSFLPKTVTALDIVEELATDESDADEW